MPGSSNGYTATAVERNLVPPGCVTNAYTSVVLAASSSVMSGASMWLDAAAGAVPARSAAAALAAIEAADKSEGRWLMRLLLAFSYRPRQAVHRPAASLLAANAP